ncbi:Ger(x)C family spore germination protein [Paenibacillus sp. NFR01]|uniref:Ger(x)C family spore germination protein n=1 Tax=Paenibacillus sp. NFR01 TaxID=1566279 RepID=UPI0008C37D84|nr:Ger(x)C family spore germination protein [Paenibacillus sp. NFR01]SET37028.1 spore germination protein KC [Paenibacillus sp. NFR01]
MKNKTLRSLRKAVLIFLMPLLLSGCWDSVELNRRAIVSGVAFDLGKSDMEKYVVSFQVIVADEISGQKTRGTSPVALYTGKGRTIFEALSNASRQTARFLSLGHVRVLVVSEELARQGISDMLDTLERESDARLTSLMFISKGQPAKDILSTMTVFSKIPANDLVEKLETTSKQYGYNYRMEVDDIIRGVKLPGGGPIINGVFTRGNRGKADNNDNLKTIAPQVVLNVSDLAAFKGDKMVGWLSGSEAFGTVILHNKIRQFPLLILHPGQGFISFNIYKSQVGIRAIAKVPERPVIKIKISLQAELKESPNNLDLTSSVVLQKLARQIEEEARSQVLAGIQAARKMNSDFLGFGLALERANPRGWKRVEGRWNEIFQHCKTDIYIDAVIRHTDMRSNSLKNNK